jgi:hypothetical protein
MKRLFVAAGFLLATGTGFAQSDINLGDEWRFRAAVYGWFPDARATSNVAVPGRGTVTLDTEPGSYLSKLEFAFMGTLEARRGPWSFVADGVYVNFGNNGNAQLPVPVNAHLDLSAFVGTLEAGFAIVPGAALDAMAGARYLHLDMTVDYQFVGVPVQGSVSTTKDYWDGVVGLRGRSDVTPDWFVSYYADVGTGATKLTWQAFAGAGYHFKWGDLLAGYRYLSYDFKDGEPLSDLRLGGPLVGVAFRF